MDAHGYRQCTPLRPGAGVATEPFLDLRSGYILRSLDQLPRQGERVPWRLHGSYARDVLLLRHGPLEDEGIEFSGAGVRAEAAPLSGVS
jgi:hypothetical protein